VQTPVTAISLASLGAGEGRQACRQNVKRNRFNVLIGLGLALSVLLFECGCHMTIASANNGNSPFSCKPAWGARQDVGLSSIRCKAQSLWQGGKDAHVLMNPKDCVIHVYYVPVTLCS